MRRHVVLRIHFLQSLSHTIPPCSRLKQPFVLAVPHPVPDDGLPLSWSSCFNPSSRVRVWHQTAIKSVLIVPRALSRPGLGRSQATWAVGREKILAQELKPGTCRPHTVSSTAWLASCTVRQFSAALPQTLCKLSGKPHDGKLKMIWQPKSILNSKPPGFKPGLVCCMPKSLEAQI